MKITKNQVPKQKTFSSVLMASPSDPNPHQPKRPARDEDAGKRATCIIDTRTSENPQTRIEEKLDDLTKGVADIPSKVCDEFMKRCVESEKQLVTKSKEAEELRSEVQSLKKQLKQEKADSQDKVQQLQTKSLEAKGLGSELQSLKEQLQQQKADSQEKVAGLTTTIHGLDEEKRKLREVILGNASRHEVSDDEIRQRFVNIRQQIQAVVNNPAYDKTREFMHRAAANDFELRIHQRYNSYSPEDRVFLMRSTVYQIICHFILTKDAFGLTGPVQPLQRYQEAHLDDFLGSFEGLSRTRKVANDVISDWRLATFKCIENFGAALPPRDNSIARTEILRFLLPLLNSKLDLVKTQKEISQLCNDALSLRLLTRKSADRYQFEGPGEGVEFCPAKGSTEVCGVLGGGEVSNFVAFSICGGLIKYTGNEESEVTCVLEPAHVVVQAKGSESHSAP
ncbi:uncharacterized protein CPUR_03157 [Claviceps purpurea 20.1]|uniref:Uncharacterized protein n=1 Tax=Claviceps purpurea (strain 20.1) TaxID=1111077 RepID=M1WDI0_CLAP2|nr:uncharacterized protein CPUR_03157 [Claviceps purpurea 20.1]